MTTLVARRSSWIPWIFVIGMAVVVVVNGVLITMALSTFPGLVVQRPYDRGIAYNDELRRNQVQAALGWQVTPRYLDGNFTVRIADAAGVPITGLVVQATLSRPLEADVSIDTTLTSSGQGYHAALVLPKRGQWEARIVATGPAGDYRAAYRLTVP